MADIEKPDLTNKWAQEGAVIKPTDAKIRLGWTSEVPPHQWQNWWQQRVDSSLSYSLQKGIPEWNEEAEYIADKSFVQLGGDIYKCIQTNTGENPSSKPAYWKPLREVYSEELELGSASRVDMGTGGAQIRTNSQNDSRYIQGGSVAQSTGSSTTNVMSQKAVTDEFNNLKDGARRDVVSSPTDASGSNKLVTQGWMGLGLVNRDYRTVDQEGLDNLGHSGFFYVNSSNNNLPGHATVIPLSANGDKTWNPQIAVHTSGTRTDMYLRSSDGQGDYHDWQEIHHTGNILKTTGNNDNFPMSQKAVSDQLLGVGQTWQDVTNNRSLDTNYTNTTGRTIYVIASTTDDAEVNVTAHGFVDGVRVASTTVTAPSSPGVSNISFPVPAGGVYRVTGGNADTLYQWAELR